MSEHLRGLAPDILAVVRGRLAGHRGGDVPRDYIVARELLERLLEVLLNPEGEPAAWCLDPVSTREAVDRAISEVERMRDGPSA